MSEDSSVPRVVIIGAGFGGLVATKALRAAPVGITLIDQRNHHLFQPLLYQVATAALNPSNIAAPIRRILRRQRNVDVVLGKVLRIDTETRRVVLSDGEYPYDYLIVATGVTHSYFGHEEWARNAPGLKSIEDALEIRRRVFLAYERAELERDPEKQRAWLTFVVVGGGPTGVELAGALAEISRFTLARDFDHIDPTRAQVILIEGSPNVLSVYPPSLQNAAQDQLVNLGVEVRVGLRVTAIDADGVSMGDDRIAAKTVLWAAGVAGSPLGASLGAPLDRAGRVIVQPDLSIPGHPEVFVIGDLANVQHQGQLVPGVAPAAIQMADRTAANIQRLIAGQDSQPFAYWDKGSMATIGRAAAVAMTGKFKFSGWFAWLLWSMIHIFFLIGFRNRFAVMLEWMLYYFTFDRGARLITETAQSVENSSKANQPIQPLVEKAAAHAG